MAPSLPPFEERGWEDPEPSEDEIGDINNFDDEVVSAFESITVSQYILRCVLFSVEELESWFKVEP